MAHGRCPSRCCSRWRARRSTLARTAGLSPWKGGGFGMFSTTDDAGRRLVRVFVSAPERSEEIAIAPSLEDAAARAAVLPGDASSRAWRAGWSSASAGITARWRPSASRPGGSSTRPARWRRRHASCATSHTVWTRLLQPARDDVGVADSVLKLTAIILLLRPFDIWWVAPFALAAACLSLIVRGRQAGADHVAVSGGARGGPDRRSSGRSPTTTSTSWPTGAWRSDWRSSGPTPAATLATSSRWLLGAAFAMAVLWKAVLSRGLRGWPVLPRDAPDRRAVCRCVDGVWRPDAGSDGAEPQVPGALAGRRRAAGSARRSSSRRVCGCSRRWPPGAGWRSKR